MKRRAIFTLCAALCAATAVISGCAASGSGSILILDGVVGGTSSTVKMYGNRADRYSLSVIESTLQKFMAENSVIATYESATDKAYLQSLERRYSSANLDDIFTIEHDLLFDMKDSGILADLTQTVDIDSFNDIVKSQLYIEGSIYAVPTSISTYGLYVNHDLLAEYGYTQAPTTLAEFSKMCATFKNNAITPIICNNFSSISSLIYAVGMYGAYSGGNTAGELKEFNSNPTALYSGISKGIDFVYEMIANDWIDIEQAALCEQGTTDLELFSSGQYPFMIAGSWTSDTNKEKEGKQFEYIIYPYPVLENGSVLVVKPDMLSVKKGENEELSKKLVSLMTKSETLLSLNHWLSRFSPLKDLQEDASEEIILSASNLQEGKFVICGDMRLSVPLESYLSTCSALILQNKSAEDVKATLYSLLGGTADE